jgi:long-chain acyl-CoA synthetase
MEKVYRASVLPVLRDNENIAKWLKFSVTRKFISRIIGRKLKGTFGGRLKFFGIGGAPLDLEVEQFLAEAKFPYSIGYGLTETAPLIAGGLPKKHFVGKIGKLVEHVDVKLEDPDPKTGVGEILVKGPNVMQGYYDNEKLNQASFTSDGYFRTGDLGHLDKHGRLSIKGRTKTMILGSGGENIYPELIEAVINNQSFVTESLVIPEKGGLIALIKIDIELFAQKMALNVNDAKAEALKYVAKIREDVNKELSAFSRLSAAELQEEPFQRTPTQKIKRFLYSRLKDDGPKEQEPS